MSDIQLQLDLARADFRLSVNVRLPAQGISVIYGASGSGKTTLLRAVAGLEPHARGRVQVGASIWQDDASGICLHTAKRPLGYVFQEASLLTHLDVAGNLAYGLKRSPVGTSAQREAILKAAIERLGIGGLLQRRSDQLSGGERQRVAIARALVTQPTLLLLDEPLASLDQARRQDILPWLEKLRDELSIPMLYVTHAADEVVRLADTLVVMQAGQIKAQGPVADVMVATDAPLIVGDDVAALIAGQVIQSEARWHLACIGFDGGQFWVPDTGLTVGQAVRVRVLARDVSVALHPASDTSIQNLVSCVIESLAAEQHPSQVLVKLRCGATALLARLTARAVSDLGLSVGQVVWAQVKSVALVK